MLSGELPKISGEATLAFSDSIDRKGQTIQTFAVTQSDFIGYVNLVMSDVLKAPDSEVIR